VLLLFLGLLVIGLAGYLGLAGLWPRFISAHIGGLGIIGLLACWAGTIAKNKSHNYGKAFFAAIVPSIILGIISVCVVYASGGHGCGGIVSLSVAMGVCLYYLLARKGPGRA